MASGVAVVVTCSDESVTHTDEGVTHTDEGVTRTDEGVTRTDESVTRTDESVTHTDGVASPFSVGTRAESSRSSTRARSWNHSDGMITIVCWF